MNAWLTKRLLRPLTIWGTGTAAWAAPIAWAAHDPCAPFLLSYGERLRSDVFNGSLTLAGFLLSVATFIVTSMKNDVYDKPDYLRRHVVQRELHGTTGPVYAPLAKLTRTMVAAVFACLVTGVLHATVVYQPNVYAVAVCCGAAAGSLALVLFAVFAAYVNFKDSLEFAEAEAQRRLAEASNCPAAGDGSASRLPEH